MKIFIRLLFCVLLIISFYQLIYAQDSCWQDGAMITYTQEDWGGDPSAGAAKLLYDHFSSIYPSGLVVGDTTKLSILFDNVNDLLNYLPASGAAGVLTNSVTNPSSTPAGEFGGAVIALKLDIDFSDSGLIEGTSGLKFGDLILTGFDGTHLAIYDGLSVRDFFSVWPNRILAEGYQSAEIDEITFNLSAAFKNGAATDWAQKHLLKKAVWNDGDMFTDSKEYWAAGYGKDTLAYYYYALYGTTYPTVGINAPGYFYLIFSGAGAMSYYLNQFELGPGPLDGSLLDPTSTSSGYFGQDALNLKLDIDFSDAGHLQGNVKIPFGDLTLCNFTKLTKLNGLTVRQFAAIVDTMLAGGSSIFAIYSFAQIDQVTGDIANAFNIGHPGWFTQAHLRVGKCSICGSTNYCPTASNLSLVTTEGAAINFKLKGSDPENDPITFSISQIPANGTVSISSGGSATYTPSPGFIGADQFKYKVRDGNCGTEAIVLLSVLKAKAFTGSITLTGQTDVNSFGGNNYTSVSGDLIVSGAASISDLSPLSTLTSIGGWITIDSNDSLVTLNGLNNIFTVGGLLNVWRNPALINIDALDKITATGGISITFDSALTNINGLSNITTVKGGNLSIQYNPHLTSIDPLSNITVVGGGLHITNNDKLTNLNGLSNIDSVGGLFVQNNKSLTSIEGLSTLTSVRGNLYVQNNAALSDFCALYNLISGDGLKGFYYVNGNAVNPTKEEIKAAGPCIATSALDNKSNSIPTEYKLEQNYPNPFNPITSIKYAVPNSGFVSLKVYDILGREVAALVNENKNPGNYEISFNANSLASGFYIYTLTAGTHTFAKKMLLIK